MADPEELGARVQELELRFMEQQHLIDELSGVVFEQQRVIDGLTKRVQRLADKVGGAPGLVDANADEKPPHY
jgi:SlyX protein